MNRIFAVNKPRGMTSHDVVNIVRRKTREKRVGHGGTLDPLAEGVLVIAVGREFTKQLDSYVKGEKEYVATIKLGFVSETDDEEGPITPHTSGVIDSNSPDVISIRKTLESFIGHIKQRPPVYSAMKVSGKRAYKLARAGKEIEMKARMVEIKNIELIEYKYPILQIRVTTGPGVYIRSLARDIGEKLKTGAYLSKLVRTRVANFSLETAVSPNQL